MQTPWGKQIEFIPITAWASIPIAGKRLGFSDTEDVTLADVEGDGDLDAIVANDGVNRVFMNDGLGTYTDSGQSLGAGLDDSEGLTAGDIDILDTLLIAQFAAGLPITLNCP